MAWTRLTRGFDTPERSDAVPLPGGERVRATVERNDLLVGESESVEVILAHGRLERHEEGTALITQGEHEDDVYFIIAGSTHVLVGGRHCDTRQAPQVVGEMAAGSPGRSRTATVVVDPGGAAVLCVPGDVFRSVLKLSRTVRERYLARYEEVARQNMEVMSRPASRKEPEWWVISAGVGAIGGLAAFSFASVHDWPWAETMTLVFGAAGATFCLIMFMAVPRLLLSLCLAAGFGVVCLGAAPFLPSGYISISSEWLPGFDGDLEFGRSMELGERLIWLPCLLVVFIGSWMMYRKVTLPPAD